MPLYIPDDSLPTHKYLQALFLQSKYKEGMMEFNKKPNMEYLLNDSQTVGVTTQGFLKTKNPTGIYQHVGIYAIDLLKDIIKYAESLDYNEVYLDQFQNDPDSTEEKPLVFTFKKEGIEVNLAPRVEDE
jgi:hypothetical protein